MLELQKGADRGWSRLDWLESRHSFSFAGWHDPSRMGFRSLRVLNEDRVAPAAGFGSHTHRDMEILTVVLEGALEHRDSSGGIAVLQAGDVQRMSAGSGVAHSEWNASNEEGLHFLQIWLLPARSELEPSHEEGRGLFPVGADAPAGLRAIATQAGEGGALEIQQDAKVLAGRANADAPVHYDLAPGRGVWLQAVRGGLSANGVRLATGDALRIEDEQNVTISGSPDGDFLLFDLAPVAGPEEKTWGA